MRHKLSILFFLMALTSASAQKNILCSNVSGIKGDIKIRFYNDAHLDTLNLKSTNAASSSSFCFLDIKKEVYTLKIVVNRSQVSLKDLEITNLEIKDSITQIPDLMLTPIYTVDYFEDRTGINKPTKIYYKNKVLKSEGAYVKQGSSSHQNEVRDGIWKFYDEEGNLTQEKTYKEGELIYSKAFYKNGKLQNEGAYLNGQKNGKWIANDVNGNLKIEVDLSPTTVKIQYKYLLLFIKNDEKYIW